MRLKGVWFDVCVGIAASSIAVASGYLLFNQPINEIEVLRNFVTSTIGSYIVRKFVVGEK